jgi:cytochrome c
MARSRFPVLLVTTLFLVACDDGPGGDVDEALYAQGEISFQRLCSSCHERRTRLHHVGPYLVGVEGRRAGSLRSFDYSPAMRDFGLRWDADALDAFLADPRTTVPGTKMAIEPIADPDERAALIYYLIQD